MAKQLLDSTSPQLLAALFYFRSGFGLPCYRVLIKIPPSSCCFEAHYPAQEEAICSLYPPETLKIVALPVTCGLSDYLT